ncbi:MAG: hypothetical protein HY731_05460 [Candidatus Tectomicrobia bacterium]|nr:hypothetical protein [Candidatus Tectomicrobia bacterium]
MKLRIGDPWMSGADYGRSLKALTINLLVRDIEIALLFQREVLGVTVIYSDPDFAVLQGYGAEWMIHADHTYQGHAMEGILIASAQRGVGVELRLHGRDPDEAERAALRLGFRVLTSAMDKPHGLREAYVMDADSYIWVPDVHLKG